MIETGDAFFPVTESGHHGIAGYLCPYAAEYAAAADEKEDFSQGLFLNIVVNGGFEFSF